MGLLAVAAALSALAFQVREEPQGPAQPIAFSHRLHAGELQISCPVCHITVQRSPVASVPPVQTCYGCHRLLNQEAPEIQKIFEHWEQKKPIPWVRVHWLADFVYFSHKRHVRAGVECQNCHGEVEQMERIHQVAPLTMGWCVECHQQRNAPLECSTCHK